MPSTELSYEDLPLDLHELILSYLSIPQLYRLRGLSQAWFAAILRLTKVFRQPPTEHFGFNLETLITYVAPVPLLSWKSPDCYTIESLPRTDSSPLVYRQLAGGASLLAALTSRGQVYAANLSPSKRLEHLPWSRVEIPETIIQIVAGSNHLLLLSHSHRLYEVNYKPPADELPSIKSIAFSLQPGEQIISLYAGGAYSLILTNQQRGFAWSTSDKQLESNLAFNAQPLVVTNLPQDIVEVALCDSHWLVLTQQGEVYGCGSNKLGQLGWPDTASRLSLTRLEFTERVCALGIGYQYSLLLTETGNVYGAGLNVFGQVGIKDEISIATFQRLNLPASVKALTTVPFVSLAITNDNTLWCWGDKSHALIKGKADVKIPRPSASPLASHLTAALLSSHSYETSLALRLHWQASHLQQFGLFQVKRQAVLPPDEHKQPALAPLSL